MRGRESKDQKPQKMKNGDVDDFEDFASKLARIGRDFEDMRTTFRYLNYTNQTRKRDALEKLVERVVAEKDVAAKIALMDKMHEIFFDTIRAARAVVESDPPAGGSQFADKKPGDPIPPGMFIGKGREFPFA